jgi:hypothetical protein
MQINNKTHQQDLPDEIEEEEEEDYDDYTKRDLELENIAGNLMIAEYRIDKLRNKLRYWISFF